MRGKTNRGPGLCAGSPLDSPRLARLRTGPCLVPLCYTTLCPPERFAPSRLPKRATPSCPGGRPSSLRSASLFHLFAPLQDHGSLLISYPPLQGRLSSFPCKRLPCSRSSSRTPFFSYNRPQESPPRKKRPLNHQPSSLSSRLISAESTVRVRPPPPNFSLRGNICLRLYCGTRSICATSDGNAGALDFGQQ